jgi:hypothetical protein
LTEQGIAPQEIGKLTVAQLRILITPAPDAGTRNLMSIAAAQKLRSHYEAERERWIAERLAANRCSTNPANVVQRASIESLRILKELELDDHQCDSGDVQSRDCDRLDRQHPEMPLPTRSELVATGNPLATRGRGAMPAAEHMLSEILNILNSPNREFDVPRFAAGRDL